MKSIVLLSLLFITDAFAYVMPKALKWETGSTIVLSFAQDESEENVNRFLQTAAYWSKGANLKFAVITDPSYRGFFHRLVLLSDGKDPRYATYGFGGAATLGKGLLTKKREMQSGYYFTRQTDSKGFIDLRLAVHEFGHVLGFDHEFDHPDFYDLFNIKLFSKELHSDCREFPRIWGNMIKCEPEAPVSERKRPGFYLSETPDIHSSLSYLYLQSRHFYVKPEFASAIIPSEGDVEALLELYPSVPAKSFEDYASYLIDSSGKNCGTVGRIYRPGEAKNPCGSGSFGYKVGSAKSCFSNVIQAYGSYVSTCTEYGGGALPMNVPWKPQQHDVVLIEDGKYSSWSHQTEPDRLAVLLEQQSELER